MRSAPRRRRSAPRRPARPRGASCHPACPCDEHEPASPPRASRHCSRSHFSSASRPSSGMLLSSPGAGSAGSFAGVERRVLAQDRLLQPPQIGAGLDADLLNERLPGLTVRVERVGLPAGAIQREHPLQVQLLAQRLLEHQPLELADHLAVPARGQVTVDRQLDRRQPQLLEPANLGVGERHAGHVGQHTPRHSASASRAAPFPAPFPAGDQALERSASRRPRQAAARSRARGSRSPPRRRPAACAAARCSAGPSSARSGRMLAPHALDEPVHRNAAVHSQRQHREHRALFRRAQFNRRPSAVASIGPRSWRSIARGGPACLLGQRTPGPRPELRPNPLGSTALRQLSPSIGAV